MSFANKESEQINAMCQSTKKEKRQKKADERQAEKRQMDRRAE